MKFNNLIVELDLPQVPAEAAHRTIGLHLDDAFVQLAGEQHAAHRDEESNGYPAAVVDNLGQLNDWLEE